MDADLLRDALRYRALRKLCEDAVGAHLLVNEHRLFYEEEPHEDGAVRLDYYPHTPVGFDTIGGPTFDAMADAAIAAVPELAARRIDSRAPWSGTIYIVNGWPTPSDQAYLLWGDDGSRVIAGNIPETGDPTRVKPATPEIIRQFLAPILGR